jgi:hypothetical protein
MALDPEADRPQAKQQSAEALPQAAAKPAAKPAPAARGKKPGWRTPGEAYTPMPEFPRAATHRWRYVAAAAVLALALTFVYLRLKPPSSHGSSTLHAAAVYGSQGGIKR